MASVKIGFVLLSGRHSPLPSTRISVLNMLPYLERSGFETHILFEPREPSEKPDLTGVVDRAVELGLEIIYFQKVSGTSVLRTARDLGALGKKTVFGVCDLIDNDMAAATDATVAVTDYLKSLYDPALHHKISVVHDGIEAPDMTKPVTERCESRRDGRLKAVLVTSSELYHLPTIERIPRFLEVTVVGRYPTTHSTLRRTKAALSGLPDTFGPIDGLLAIEPLLSGRLRTVPWSKDTVYALMAAADIGIIPVDMRPDPIPSQDVSMWQVKSENRLTMKMSMGLAVIASPVPSYLPLIEHGVNGFIASDRQEWIDCLERLRNPALRQEMGARARSSVTERYSRDSQARKLVSVFDRLKVRVCNA